MLCGNIVQTVFQYFIHTLLLLWAWNLWILMKCDLQDNPHLFRRLNLMITTLQYLAMFPALSLSTRTAFLVPIRWTTVRHLSLGVTQADLNSADWMVSVDPPRLWEFWVICPYKAVRMHKSRMGLRCCYECECNGHSMSMISKYRVCHKPVKCYFLDIFSSPDC